jgi:hypothetical protein
MGDGRADQNGSKAAGHTCNDLKLRAAGEVLVLM